MTVLDVNDNSPMFSQSQYEFSLQEHSPVGEVLASVIATDNDIGSNAILTYSLSTGAGQFIVNNATGILCMFVIMLITLHRGYINSFVR